MNFAAITLEDKNTIEKYTVYSDSKCCYLNFLNLICWQDLFKTQFAIKHDFLFMRYRSQDAYVYIMPMGRGKTTEAFDILLDFLHTQAEPFKIQSLSPHDTEVINDIFHNQIVWDSNRDSSEYIYLRRDLATLAGKRLQPKRNHINQFLRAYPDYEYLPLTKELTPQCITLYELWRENTANRVDMLSRQTEHSAILLAFANYDTFNLSGGVLKVNDKIVAFTYGSAINNNTFDICVEKADTAYIGAYTMINREFIRTLPENFEYINREEDLGLLGLRQAKMSYSPACLLEKYIGTPKF
ncbi:MAG: phosphatidylglycerol lysyltransferase domain-containing protein [Paludibacter sp.]|jgi:hypothetical protein|nr:phosphatidylglycerol lysyltransferase domain-containing protein [Paludibacter sp.]